ncbi:3-methyl-2-oxobutanoate dehydrogenase subunit VorB [bacterium]|nr:3-methyl-2-oxobutanoate dehydrogenase subunit VorB [bacterium]
MAKVLMKGNEALAEAAIMAGCKLFFGYPITPQNEIPEYLSRRLPQVDGGCYLQAESEVAAANMLYGAAGVGERVLTSSSGPGISLMSEGLSYIAGAQLPVVVVNMVRGGPGLGGILPAQSDYYQATRGLGHGDFRVLVLAPSTVQEAADLVMDAFDLADKYRSPVMVLGDGLIGQMMEPVEFKKKEKVELPPKTWAATGYKGDRERSIINSLYLDPLELEENSWRLKARYDAMGRDELRWELTNCEGDYDVLITAYGSTARICKTVIETLKKQGISVGLFRPITLFPYPYKQLRDAAQKAKTVFCVEMSTGQMLDDVKLALEGSRPTQFYGRTGGIIPTPDEIIGQIEKILKGEEVDKR